MQTTHSTASFTTQVACPPVVLPAQTPIDAERLARARLGSYAGLFLALRMKHPPTAAHTLRVALTCSKWAAWRSMPEEERGQLEVAALLHDVGKIGIPDRVLQKPTSLDGTELTMMDMAVAMASEMLLGAGASQGLVEIVEQARWKLPENPNLPARMMSIVDAFDSMTTEQVFRRAMSQERAITELCGHAGTQFDPALIREFAEVISAPREDLDQEMAGRWMSQFALATPGFGESVPISSGAVQNILDKIFHHHLLDSLDDAVVYLDAGRQILCWNRAAEKLTGRTASSVLNTTWSSEILGLVDLEGQTLAGSNCPLQAMALAQSQISIRANIRRNDGRSTQVQFSALPVFANDRSFTGMIVLIRDASAQANLEERVQTLHAIASRDPLTGVANRGALNGRLAQLVEEANTSGRRTSVVMCDIDFFKRMNDRHGHAAGDTALKLFAQLLGHELHDEDLVARYGGEEFVLLCPGYDNPAATIRAENIRKLVEKTPMPALGGEMMTASFGVTEVQQGDSVDTVLARADRALMLAKQGGRNRVVQTGNGWNEEAATTQPERRVEPEPAGAASSWLGWFRSEAVVEKRAYLSMVPEELAIQKLKGFIADHRGEIVSAESSRVSVRIDCHYYDGARRMGERPAVVALDIQLDCVQFVSSRSKTYQQCSRFQITARPIKSRDRRGDVIRGQINQILQSFQIYVGAQLIDAALAAKIIEPRV